MHIYGIDPTTFRPQLPGVSLQPDHLVGAQAVEDRATISPEAQSALDRERAQKGLPGQEELSPEEQDAVRELERRDREVRAHEQAHAAAAGSLAAGGPQYEYQVGPDGKRYAVGGHVDIRLGKGRTPEETLRIAQQAQAAAMAPVEPSGADRAVAAKAAALEAEARREIQADRSEKQAHVSSTSLEYFTSETQKQVKGSVLDYTA